MKSITRGAIRIAGLIGLSVAFANSGAQTLAKGAALQCTVVLEKNVFTVIPLKESPGKCREGSRVRLMLYKANPFLVDQLCNLDKTFLIQQEGSDSTFEQIYCSMTGKVADPNATFRGASVLIAE